AAPVETVWDVLTAVERWPTWNPDVKTVSLEGSVAEGSVFRWKAGPGTITSTIQRVDRPRLIAWTGKTFGIDATHVWRLEQGHGKTLVRTEESYEGLVASILRRPLRKALETALTNGLRSLKVEAERRTPA
ncbi:MAG: SRPBCC family protein, partial [Gaiellaceae bacterium]